MGMLEEVLAANIDLLLAFKGYLAVQQGTTN